MTEKYKQSLYFPQDVLEEIQREANRLDRSLSWVVQQAWAIARAEVGRNPSFSSTLPTVTGLPRPPPPRESAPPPPPPDPSPPREEHRREGKADPQIYEWLRKKGYVK